jgi:TRAP-type uncharacterized transport system fused permease subunit
MTDKQTTRMETSGADLTEEQKKKLEQLMEEEEGATRKVVGFWNQAITWLAIALSVFTLYTAIVPVTTQILRSVFVAFLLALSFLYYPTSPCRFWAWCVSAICSSISRSSSTGR